MTTRLRLLSTLVCAGLLAGCAVSLTPTPLPFRTNVPTASPSTTPKPTSTATPTNTFTPSPSPTERPLTLEFYGDSLLKVGDVSRESDVGFSIVDLLSKQLNPADTILLSNHGGLNARWGFENLQKNVLDNHPDIVTLWWGLNDLNGCPGIFDPTSDELLQYKLDAMLNLHLMYMTMQIKAMLEAGMQVIVITPIPVDTTLPWTHLDQNNVLVWENDHRCDFNLGLEQLVEAQRSMVAGFEAKQSPVFLVDSWQIYKDHPNSDKMYMDIVHPGSYGAKLIAEDWLRVFQSMNKK